MNLSEKEETGDITDQPELYDNNAPRFEVSIRQSNINIEIQNHEVTLEKRNFDIVLHFFYFFFVLVNGSFIS
jgi:hypothetical protein